jgi:hypothetical protein
MKKSEKVQFKKKFGTDCPFTAGMFSRRDVSSQERFVDEQLILGRLIQGRLVQGRIIIGHKCLLRDYAIIGI